jgi:hypothetical protein
MITDSRKTQLEETIRTARAELDAIRFAERRTAAAALVGKCFAYRNSYSCPQSEADYWTLYLRVTGVTGEGEAETVTFQMDKDGRVSIELSALPAEMFPGRYREIPYAELERAWLDLLSGPLVRYGFKLQRKEW